MTGVTDPDSGIKTQVILTGYGIIWGMDFLPDNDLIFTEKSGKVYRKHGETVTEIIGFPEVRDNGQGGLLDIRVHPGYGPKGGDEINIIKKGFLLRIRDVLFR